VFALGDSQEALALPQHFPNIKIINWFDIRKAEAEAGGNSVDWSITSTATSGVRAGYLQVCVCVGPS
jgi:hypothetical protein